VQLTRVLALSALICGAVSAAAQERVSPQVESVLLTEFQRVFEADADNARLLLLFSPT